MPIQPSEDTSYIIEIVAKIVGVFLSFVGGIVTATWVVRGKIQGFDDRLKNVETVQMKCQGHTLVQIDNKLKDIDDKLDNKLDRIHERIDEVLMQKQRSER